MHEPTARPPQPADREREAAPLPVESIFAGPPRYPLDGQPSPARGTPSASLRKLWMPIVLPLVVFLAAVAVLAWVMQNLPSRGRTTPEVREGPKAPALAQFYGMTGVLVDKDTGRAILDKETGQTIPVQEWVSKGQVVALWNPQLPDYAAEYEVAWGGYVDNGYYDFPVKNPADVPIELTVLETSCVCSRVQICLLTEAELKSYELLKKAALAAGTYGRQTIGEFTWNAMEKGKPFTLPADATGQIRVFWDGNKQLRPEALNPRVTMGVHATGTPAQQQETVLLTTPVVFVRPVRFSSEQLDAGTLGSDEPTARLTFHCWSTWRDFTATGLKADPCFVIEPKLLTKDECRQLEADLAKGRVYTKVRSAYRVEVTLHEQRDKKQLDLGWLQSRLPMTFAVGAETLDLKPPMLEAMVVGEVRLIQADKGAVQQNKIRLENFRSKDGVKCKVILTSKNSADLEYVRCEPDRIDADVKLTKKGTAGATTNWEMDLHLRPDNEPGPLPDDCVLILRHQGMSRLIRIRLMGTIVRG